MNDIALLAQKTRTKTVLYVEDDKAIRQNVSELLSNLFGLVVSAVDGLDGLENYKQRDFDFVITDIKMPKMNGLVMIEEILKLKADQAIVITTAHDEKEYIEKFKSMGIEKVLQKPITFDSLLKTIKEMVA